MPEDGLVKAEIEHIKSDIIDIKNTAKDQTKDMLSMRDSHTETRIYIRQIQDSQTATKDSLNAMSKKAEDNQALTMKTLQEIQDEPKKEKKKKDFAIWVFAVTYGLGSLFGIIKTLAPQLLQ